MNYLFYKYGTLFTILLLVLSNMAFGQSVGISDVSFTPNSQSILDLSSDRKGFLPPRVDLDGPNAPINGTKPAGLMVYNAGGDVGPDGIYYWTGSAWVQVSTSSGTVAGSGTLNYLSKWTPDGSTLGNSTIYDNGNVGINTTSPSSKLMIHTGTSSAILTDYTQAIGNGHGIIASGSYTNGNYNPGLFWATGNDNPTKPKAGIFLQLNSAGSKMLFGTSTDYTTGLTNTAMAIDDLGKVGLGTVTPTQVLDVNGKIRMRTGATNGYIPVSDANGAMTWTDPSTVNTAEDDDWTISGSNQYSAVAGNVGIGISSPGSKLHVSGNVSVSGSLPSNVWGQVAGFGSSGSGGVAQGIIGHQGGHELNLYWNFHRIDGSSTFTGLSANGYSSANGMSFGNGGILFHATTSMGSSRPGNVMIIENGGNVGIGESTIAAKLHVNQDVADLGLYITGGNSGVDIARFKRDVGGSGTIGFNGSGSNPQMYFDDEGSNGIWSIGTESGTNTFRIAANASIGTNDMVSIQQDGNVGLGTVNPAGKLVINPGASGATSIGGRSVNLGSHLYSVSGRTGYSVQVANAFTGDSDNAGFYWMFPHASGGNANHKPFRAAVGSTLSDIFFVEQDGDGYFAGELGIGSTTPSGKLDIYNSGTGGSGIQAVGEHVNISAFAPNITLNDLSSGTDNYAMHVNQGVFTIGPYTSATSMSNDLVIYNNNVGMGVINGSYKLWVNGTAAKPGGGSWTNASDKRLKQDIQPYSDGLEKIMAIRPVTYHYNRLSGYDTNPEYVGVIAQELQQVAPYMVGSYELDGNKYLDVNNSAMMYMLVNAVQEQQAIIEKERTEKETMQLQIEELMRRVDKLEQR